MGRCRTACALLALSACASACGIITEKGPVSKVLWSETDPDEPVRILQTDATEAELLQQGRRVYRTDDRSQSYVVEKSRIEKARDYAIRTVCLPPAAAADTAVWAVAVGVLLPLVMVMPVGGQRPAQLPDASLVRREPDEAQAHPMGAQRDWPPERASSPFLKLPPKE